MKSSTYLSRRNTNYYYATSCCRSFPSTELKTYGHPLTGRLANEIADVVVYSVSVSGLPVNRVVTKSYPGYHRQRSSAALL